MDDSSVGQNKNTINRFLCGHIFENNIGKSGICQCQKCGSFWDLSAVEAEKNHEIYDSEYPIKRGHFIFGIGENKVKTLRLWLNSANLDHTNLNVCEVGFGAGFTLKYLSGKAAGAFGVEKNKMNIDFAKSNFEIPGHRLFLSSNLPNSIGVLIDMWIFQDSFEHIIEVEHFMEWVEKNSSNKCTVLMVAPRADSLSSKLMGRFWIHRIQEHQFHWSKAGVVNFFRERNFELINQFYPLKYITLGTILSHFCIMIGVDRQFFPQKLFWRLSFLFNFGEMGLVFKITKTKDNRKN